MSASITIKIGGLELSAELYDCPAAQVLRQALPLKLSMSRWGEEYYGSCGLAIQADASARERMEVGEIAYWPPGNAFCIFFGPTPASTDDRPRAASAVAPLGRISGNMQDLKALGSSVEAEILPG